MFNQDFYPTPKPVIDIMLSGEDIYNKIVLEPNGGKGDIVDELNLLGAKDVLSCEIEADLRKILAHKCNIIADDFLTVESHQISHIDMIVMNPPFSKGAEHLLHAYNIAPKGCKIIALVNSATINNPFSKTREELVNIVNTFGSHKKLGDVFADAERRTKVEVSLVKITKAGVSYENEFDGFCMDEEPIDAGSYGIMQYDFVRDLVQRYIGAVKIYDKQLEVAKEMNGLLSNFYSSKLSMSITEDGIPKARNEFKKDLQKSAWQFIFSKMKMDKYNTTKLRDDMNKFIETQYDIPFTMKNIYHMLDCIIQTHESRMDEAIMEIFDKLTRYSDENRYNVQGWKTNSHFLLGKKFILGWMTEYSEGSKIKLRYGGSNSNLQLVDDFMKALCYITGENYDKHYTLENYVRYKYKLKDNNGDFIFFDTYKSGWNELDGFRGVNEVIKELYAKGRQATLVTDEMVYGQWFDWGFFRVKGFKKGSMHFEFKDMDVWARINQRIAKIMGYPLFEAREQTAYQDRNTGRKKSA